MRWSRSLKKTFCVVVVGGLALTTFSAAGATASDQPHGLSAHKSASASSDTDNGETQELMDRAEQYAAVRTAPGTTVSTAAFRSAQQQAAALPAAPGQWQELTKLPYNSDAVDYRDPFWSNSSGGAGLVSGRMSALASDGNSVYAGAADGGVWKTTDKGAHWTPIFETQSRLSIGALAVNPADHSIWAGTGEANTAFENYNGDGIYRSADGGTSWQLVGNHLDNSLISRITFDGVGNVYAATSNGLVRRSASNFSSPWTNVLKPDPNPDNSPYRTSWISDVTVRPGTNGNTVIAALGWRGGTAPDTYSYNGFYESDTGGGSGTFNKVDAQGIQALIGRTSFSYSPDGSLYAVVESPDTVDYTGVFRSTSGVAAGPWTLVVGKSKLASAPNTAVGDPGAQAWYDQYVLVDPADAKHLYLGLEEIYESNDRGQTWTSIGPYWNFGKPCWSEDPAKNTCPNTTHPDQHAVVIASDGTAYFGNDGGIYSRASSLRTVVQWNDLNSNLHTLQYYYAGIGRAPGGDAIWGGLQDNGTSLLTPGAAQMVSPFGGDGGDVIVDPNDARRAVNEYVYLTMARTQNGGKSDGTTRSYTTITPTCASTIAIEFNPKPCDPNPRFIAPFTMDPTNSSHWVAGGQIVWDNQGAGWSTVCNSSTCDWKHVRDLGPGAQTTALGVSGPTIYAGWCGNGCNPGGSQPFVSGIDTNYGGAWHRVTAPNLPNRIPTNFFIDPDNSGHVFVTFGAFSRRWIPGAGVGHVFESTDGGATWTDRSGDLPDAPANDIVLLGSHLIVGTDVGVFSTPFSSPGSWSRVGSNLPNASTNDLAVSPAGDYVVAATHGRGLWRFTPT
jgi:hypothetical protein